MTQPSPVKGAPPPEDAAPDARSQSGAVVIPMTGRVLLSRHANGDRDAFRQLVQAYAKPIYGILAGSGVPADERDDLFQEIFVKVHRAAGRRMPTGPVRPWLFTIAVNTVRDHLRRQKVRSIVSLDGRVDRDAPDASTSADPRAVAVAKETAGFLAGHIARLPLNQHEALMLCSVQGLSIREAAGVLGAPVDTVKTRLRRARLAPPARAVHDSGGG
ncbi:MAG: RNA polymerase sigma factor [Sandaracinaceae bacterium]